MDQAKLSPDGQKLIQDCRDIIETSRLMVQEKNADEIFQNFLWNTNYEDFTSTKKDPSEVLPADKSKAKDDARDGNTHHRLRYFRPAHTLPPTAARHLRTLANLIATNREVRKILADFSVIGRDILASAATQVAHTVRPTQEAISNVDRPAPSDQFETAGGKQVGPDETPVAEIPIPSANGAVRHHPHEGVEVERDGQILDASQAADEAQGRAQEVAGEASAITEYVHIAVTL